MGDEFDDVSVEIPAEVPADVPAVENVEIEPIADIPVEEPMDTAFEITPDVSTEDLSTLQSEAEALEIQPLDETFEIQGDSTYSPGQRILAGAMTPFVAIGEGMPPLSDGSREILANPIPDHVQVMEDHIDPLDGMLEQIREQYPDSNIPDDAITKKAVISKEGDYTYEDYLESGEVQTPLEPPPQPETNEYTGSEYDLGNQLDDASDE